MADLDLLLPKLLGHLIRADLWLWFGLLTVAWALWRRWHRLAGWVMASLVAAVTLVGFVPVGSVWLAPLEARFPANPHVPGTPSAIIVLGGGEAAPSSAAWQVTNTQVINTNDAGDRFLQALRRAQDYPGAPIVFTGGAFDPTRDPFLAGSAERVGEMLMAAGLDPSRLVISGGARTTAEHPADIAEALEGLDIQPTQAAPLLVITSAFHMPRAMGVLCQAAIGPAIADPTDYRTTPGRGWRHTVRWNYAANLAQLQRGMREWAGLAAYHLQGRTGALLPGPCP